MGIECHVSMVLKWQLNIVRAVVLGCSHLLLIAATASARAMPLGSPHNAVHSSSTYYGEHNTVVEARHTVGFLCTSMTTLDRQ